MSDEQDDEDELEVADWIEFEARRLRHALLAAAIAAATAKFEDEVDDEDELDEDDPWCGCIWLYVWLRNW